MKHLILALITFVLAVALTLGTVFVIMTSFTFMTTAWAGMNIILLALLIINIESVIVGIGWVAVATSLELCIRYISTYQRERVIEQSAARNRARTAEAQPAC